MPEAAAEPAARFLWRCFVLWTTFSTTCSRTSTTGAVAAGVAIGAAVAGSGPPELAANAAAERPISPVRVAAEMAWVRVMAMVLERLAVKGASTTIGALPDGGGSTRQGVGKTSGGPAPTPGGRGTLGTP